MTDYLVVGLGNPSAEHANDRHNVGFRTMNALAKRLGATFSNSKLASTGKGSLADASVLLVKPRTWYNGSGRAVAQLMKRDALEPSKLIVVHDELDLPVGRIRLRPKGSSAGNNGLKSIAADVGSNDFGRVRVGIGRPKDRGVPSWDPEVVMRHVLGTPPRSERDALEEAIGRACEAIESIIRDGWERAMNTYNTVEKDEPYVEMERPK
jgi:PTH1 family peptidyl-tRNA hydrolase